MKRKNLILPVSLALLVIACSFLGQNAQPETSPTPGGIDPTVHALETSLAQPIVATTTNLPAPTPSHAPTATAMAEIVASPTSPAACLIGTWQATNIQDYVIAAIPPEMIEQYNPTYQSSSGQVYVSFFNNGLVTIQAYQLALEFEVQATIFRVGLTIALDGMASGQYVADASQVTTSNMTTTGMTASARSLEQDVMPQEQIIASLPLVQSPFNVANYQCTDQTLSLRLTAYPESIPPLQFQRVP